MPGTYILLTWLRLAGLCIGVVGLSGVVACAQDASGTGQDTLPAISWKYKPSKSRPYRTGEVVSVLLEATIPKGVRLYSTVGGDRQGYTPTVITFLDSTQATLAGPILEKGTPVERTDKATRRRIRYFEHSVTFVVSFRLLNASPELVQGQVRYSLSDERGREALRTFVFSL